MERNKLFEQTLEQVMWGLLDMYVDELYKYQENIPFE